MTATKPKPKRVQLRRAKGWRMPPNTVKVDRTTPWGNPFIVGTHGTRGECVDLYRKLMAGYLCLGTMNVPEQQRARKHVVEHHHELRGKNLACWCAIGAPCHADVLLELASQ